MEMSALIDDAGYRLLSTLLRTAYEVSGRPFEEVLEVGRTASEGLIRLLTALIPRL